MIWWLVDDLVANETVVMKSWLAKNVDRVESDADSVADAFGAVHGVSLCAYRGLCTNPSHRSETLSRDGGGVIYLEAEVVCLRAPRAASHRASTINTLSLISSPPDILRFALCENHAPAAYSSPPSSIAPHEPNVGASHPIIHRRHPVQPHLVGPRHDPR
ncbi:hypothetical protein BJ912DRAFT_275572 [Pholiota molesta]|nr:hypothetical protein BJ912DRAFT_275572 [Pholiota molesta]